MCSGYLLSGRFYFLMENRSISSRLGCAIVLWVGGEFVDWFAEGVCEEPDSRYSSVGEIAVEAGWAIGVGSGVGGLTFLRAWNCRESVRRLCICH